MSNKVEVVISFDTTGSMYPCLTQVRREVTSFIKALFKEIPEFKMGIIAHGDYCDEGSTYVIKEHDITSDQNALINFVNSCGNTNGGDAAECYELALHHARSMKWTAGTNKVFVLIGDDVPHSASERQNTKKLDWRNEIKCLLEMGVKVCGVQALGRRSAAPFYQEIAQVTGGFRLGLDQFSDVTNIIRAVCYQQAGPEFLQSFEQTVIKNGQMTKSMRSNISVLQGKTATDILSDIRKIASGSTSTGGLNPVEPSRFQVMDVDSDIRIDEFVRDNGLIFSKGKGFYEFSKRSKIQDYKEIVLMDKATGDMFSGDDARTLMGIPVGAAGKVSPVFNDKFIAFVQSTSLNRKLIGGTKFLYEVDLSR